MNFLWLAKKYKIIIGVDEAGRGALAGPVVAGAVALPSSFFDPQIKDSKLLSPSRREYLLPIIKQNAIAWATGLATPREINHMNILRATFIAMHRAIRRLNLPSSEDTLIVVDGAFFHPYPGFHHLCLPQADRKIPAVSAASIIAKTFRDRLMEYLSIFYPQYGWDINKGYYSQEHVEAIKKHGKSPLHRYFTVKDLSSLPFQKEH